MNPLDLRSNISPTVLGRIRRVSLSRRGLQRRQLDRTVAHRGDLSPPMRTGPGACRFFRTRGAEHARIHHRSFT